jgi:hypothetical protein
MTMKTLFSLAILLISMVSAFGQDYLLDINLKASAHASFDFGDNEANHLGYDRYLDVPEVSVSVEAVYFPKNFVGFGVFYTKTAMSGTYSYHWPFVDNYLDEYSSYEGVSYGLSAHLTTSRLKQFRVYAVARVGNFQTVEQFDDFTMSSKGLGYTGGFGVTVKLSRRVSYNIFEASYTRLPADFNTKRNQTMTSLQLQSGLTVKVYRKR